MNVLLNSLRAAGEPTRLRLLALLARNDLTVSELTQILGQSQPRVSRHLKLLTEAGLVERQQEGTWAFYRLASRGRVAEIAESLIGWIPRHDDTFNRDIRRLEAIRKSRREAAAAYFRRSAAEWDRIRSLHVEDTQVEQAMLGAIGQKSVEDLLDLGTGTGRVLQVFSAHIQYGLGIDLSREMLAVARANLDELSLRHCQVRHGDIYALPLPSGVMDVVTIHQVLHYLDDPGTAIFEAARTLRPGGQLLIVDFAPHDLEFLRSDNAHRRLGFADEEVAHWCEAAGLEHVTVNHLHHPDTMADKQLTVTLWSALQNSNAPTHPRLEVA